jgi:hypothetical protein
MIFYVMWFPLFLLVETKVLLFSNHESLNQGLVRFAPYVKIMPQIAPHVGVSIQLISRICNIMSHVY